MLDLSIIIVSYNTKGDVDSCLRSVYDSRFSGSIEIIVADNASTDGTRELIEDKFPGVTLLSNEKNVGFSRAVNQGLRMAQGKYFLLLNPDTLVLPFALDTLFQFMEDHADAGAASPRQWLDPEKNLQVTITAKQPCTDILTAKIPLVKKFALRALHTHIWKEDFEVWRASEPLEVSALSGACLFVRRETVEDVGYLDENFFLFFEDVDWSNRMRNKGWTLYCVPTAEIVHLGMRSVRKAQNIQRISEASRDYYIQKHFGRWKRLVWRMYSVYKSTFKGKLRIQKKAKTVLVHESQPCPSHPRIKGDATISLHWNPVEGASRYVVEISQDPLFFYKGGMIVPINRFFLSCSLIEPWSSGSYFWRFAPVFGENTLGIYSHPQMFDL